MTYRGHTIKTHTYGIWHIVECQALNVEHRSNIRAYAIGRVKIEIDRVCEVEILINKYKQQLPQGIDYV